MDTFLDALKLDVLAALPQMFICQVFIFSFLRPQPDKLWKRLAILSVIHSVYTDSLVLIIPAYIQIINSMIALFILLFLLFKELPLRKKLFLFISEVIVFIVMDIIISSIAIAVGIEDSDSLQRNIIQLITILYPILTVTFISAWFIRKRHSFSSSKFLSVHIKQNKTLLKIIALVVLQFISLGTIYAVKYASDANQQLITTILIYFSIIVSLAALVFMFRLLTQTRAEAIRSTQAVYVDDIQNMFASVRGQRHDFLNHVQVIHTMAQMGKYEQLRSYTANLVQETREVSDIINHAAPALAAFAQAKTTVALGYGIPFACELPERWNVPDSAINMLDIIKILGNLVDNAFEETTLLPKTERAVRVSISTDVDGITMEVSNRGQPIDDHTRVLIMQAGFSTKGEGHSGLGLAIVQERILHYGGTLDIKSDRATRMTTFIVRLPCEAAFIEDQPAS